jgi:hypothetical protein
MALQVVKVPLQGTLLKLLNFFKDLTLQSRSLLCRLQVFHRLLQLCFQSFDLLLLLCESILDNRLTFIPVPFKFFPGLFKCFDLLVLALNLIIEEAILFLGHFKQLFKISFSFSYKGIFQSLALTLELLNAGILVNFGTFVP